VNRRRSCVDLASKRFRSIDRVWLCVGIRNWFSMIDLSSETVVPFGLSIFTRSRPSRLRILSIMVFLFLCLFCLVVLCDD